VIFPRLSSHLTASPEAARRKRRFRYAAKYYRENIFYDVRKARYTITKVS